MSLRAVGKVLSKPGRTTVIYYAGAALIANLLWEVAQLPLYAFWSTATKRELAYVILHCTVGDFIVLLASLLLALLLIADQAWPGRRYLLVAVGATIAGVIFAVFDEWLSVEALGRWAYAPEMPLVPPLGTGLSPLLQWIVIPPAAFTLARLSRRGAHGS